jgi:cyanate lyase
VFERAALRRLPMTERATERRELESQMLRAMKAKRFSFRTLAAEAGLPPFLATAALFGRMSLGKEPAAKIAALLDIPEARNFLTESPPSSAPGREILADPLIDRLYEIVRVYGTSIKALVEEEFGDGIMSAIDFDLDLTRQPDPNGDRVKIVMTGKFLKYKKV